MQRNARTTIEALQEGDRFYRLGDRAKEVWTKVQAATKQTGYPTYKHFALKDGDHPKYPQALRNDTPVVLLRHKN